MLKWLDNTIVNGLIIGLTNGHMIALILWITDAKIEIYLGQ